MEVAQVMHLQEAGIGGKAALLIRQLGAEDQAAGWLGAAASFQDTLGGAGKEGLPIQAQAGNGLDAAAVRALVGGQDPEAGADIFLIICRLGDGMGRGQVEERAQKEEGDDPRELRFVFHGWVQEASACSVAMRTTSRRRITTAYIIPPRIPDAPGRPLIDKSDARY